MSTDPAGSPNPFDFGDETSPEPKQGPDNPFLDRPAESPDRGRLSWVALIIVAVVTLLVGLFGYARAAAYADGWDVDSAVYWVALTVLCGAVALAALVIAVVAVVRSRSPGHTTGSRAVAVIALLSALILPWFALWLGTYLAPRPPTV